MASNIHLLETRVEHLEFADRLSNQAVMLLIQRVDHLVAQLGMLDTMLEELKTAMAKQGFYLGVAQPG